ncbi:MAG: DUF6062 family protein [Treponema sp.]|jgi:RNA polymerase subunit RPABC4/transcription elongation factor Spt4|nr:DUF6062 family protein [Treponema sp.]
MDKHINFFELEKACAQSGCPLCTLVKERSERWLDDMLFEHVSDRVFRKNHRLAGGFCAFHSRNLELFRDGLAIAILGRDILEDRIEAFKKCKMLKQKSQCPVCAEQHRIEQEYLSFLIEAEPGSEHAEEMQKIFLDSEGLCTPHYAQLLEKSKHIPQWIVEFHSQKFDMLMKRVNDFIEFSAYGRQAEFEALSERDKIVWKELASNLRGSLT